MFIQQHTDTLNTEDNGKSLPADRLPLARLQFLQDIEVIGQDVAETKSPLEVRPLVDVAMGTHLGTTHNTGVTL